MLAIPVHIRQPARVPIYLQPARRRAFRVGAVVLAVVATLGIVGGSWFFGVLTFLTAVALLGVARSRVVTTPDGVQIQNPFRRRFVTWAEISGIEYRRTPRLRLQSGDSVALDGVEPFPQAFPTQESKRILTAFSEEVERAAG